MRGEIIMDNFLVIKASNVLGIIDSFEIGL
jgi:hypothetical protein